MSPKPADTPNSLKTSMAAQMRNVYLIMTLGVLGMLAIASWFETHERGMYLAEFANKGWFWPPLLLQIVIVFSVIPRVKKMKVWSSLFFIVESAFANVFAFVPLVWLLLDGASVMNALFVAAVMYGVIALMTGIIKRPFGMAGTFAFMSLIGLVTVVIANIFLHIGGTEVDLQAPMNNAEFLLSFLLVPFVAGFSAWHTKRVEALEGSARSGDGAKFRPAMQGAVLFSFDYIYLLVRMPSKVVGEVLDLMGVGKD